MNMKGVSPVVATVLLIAIAVIAAVGVWYWVGAYTSKPATTGTDMKVIQISGCVSGANPSVLVRNLGSSPITTSVNFSVYNSALTQVGSIMVYATLNSLTTTNSTIFNTSALTTGSYKGTSAGFQDVVFTCQ